MKPILTLRFLPELRCEGCGAWTYVDDHLLLCMHCFAKNMHREESNARQTDAFVAEHPWIARLKKQMEHARAIGLLRKAA